MKVMLSNYKFAFKEIFTNKACIILLLGASFRMWEVSVFTIYIPNYMKIYGDRYGIYTLVDSISVFCAGITTNIISAAIMEKFINNPMSKSYLCMSKAFLELLCVGVIFL